jgi:hypothetical protein
MLHTVRGIRLSADCSAPSRVMKIEPAIARLNRRSEASRSTIHRNKPFDLDGDIGFGCFEREFEISDSDSLKMVTFFWTRALISKTERYFFRYVNIVNSLIFVNLVLSGYFLGRGDHRFIESLSMNGRFYEMSQISLRRQSSLILDNRRLPSAKRLLVDECCCDSLGQLVDQEPD